MFKAIGADIKNFEIVKGSSFQLSKEYVYDILKMSTFTSVHDCNKASSEVVKQSDNPKLSGMIYPILQALDEQYLDVDVQYGGVDQRKILMFAREYLPKLNYKSRVEVMTPIIPGLVGKKMSASIQESKIDLLDDEATVKNKIKKAFCPEGELEDNGVMAFFKHFLKYIKEDANEEFVIERPEKWGGNMVFKTYEDLEKAFVNKDLHPMDLKSAFVDEINKLLAPIREGMKGKEAKIKDAYPEN
jgi:tyrosyl-tRNA synthetase